MSRLALSIALGSALFAACNSSDEDRYPGQTSFVSAPPSWYEFGDTDGAQGGGSGAAPGSGSATTTGTARTVEETDLYRLEGNRLYYLNAFRGLMVFDVTDVDHPALLGRSPIYGSPVDMVVNNGIAIVVVADWYGALDDGTPFRGSIVRGLDATDPTNIKVLGDAKLGGWVEDDRVVGNVIYAVSEDYGWSYGWYNNSGGENVEKVIVSSVSFANNTITSVSEVSLPGYAGIFNVTPNSIMLAHDLIDANDRDTGRTALQYLDISDPNGAIVQRGSISVDGMVQGWGADNGRWNLDFADGATAHVIGCGGENYCDDTSGFILSTVDFTNPDHPALVSQLDIPATGWSAAARFDSGRLYLSPESGWSSGSTPFQVYDLTVPAKPALAGTVTIPGSVWNILPAPQQRLFALGSSDNNSNEGEAVTLTYLDVTNPAAPVRLGTSQFGQGWAWTPATDTFKAFTMDATKGLVVLPFSGWDSTQQTYTNGLQLIEFTPTTQTTASAARTKGWVERGIFVGNRLVSLSDMSLAVVDYTNPMAPSVVTELTLARNVVASRPDAAGGSTIAEVSSDWWDNDVTTSEVRVLPIANADETADATGVPTLEVPGVDARLFTNGELAYVVTNVQTPCASNQGECRAQQVQVVDLSNGLAVPRGSISLPNDYWGWYGWGWYGFLWDDWYEGSEVVQLQGDALAFRRWQPVYDANNNFITTNSLLYLVDLSNPDAPTIASITIQPDPTAWWGNMQVVGDTLYTSHYEWVRHPDNNDGGLVKYYIDGIDLSDRSNPRVRHKINVPGMLVGADANDDHLLYTVDYRWDGQTPKNDFNVVRISGDVATLQSTTRVSGWTGTTFIQGTTAYVSAQRYPDPSNPYDWPVVDLHAIDVTNPQHPVDNVASGGSGWGWLLAVEGDRLLVTSGWGPDGLDIYTLSPGQAPQFEQTVRARGWWIDGVSRQGSKLFLSSGYWGVQSVQLQ